MTAEEKVKNLEAWARYFKYSPKEAAHFQRLAEQQRGHVPPDTRRRCPGVDEMGPCQQPAVGGGHCAAHYADGVL